jgi:hypothetical protein
MFDLDPYVTALVFAQTLCDDFSVGLGLGNASESARRKFIEQVVGAITEQVTDFKNHRVEIEAGKTANTNSNTIAVITQLPVTPSKPVSTIGGGGLTVNGLGLGLGLGAERSRSTTPLPGERTLSKKSSFVGVPTSDSGIGKKRARPKYEPEGSGVMEDEDEEWWERWRKRMRVLDAAAAKAKKLAAKNPPPPPPRPSRSTNASPRKKPRGKAGNRSSKHDGIPTNGIKVEISEHDFKHALVKVEEPDEFQKERLFVDENEPEADTGYNEELRIPIKVRIFFNLQLRFV